MCSLFFYGVVYSSTTSVKHMYNTHVNCIVTNNIHVYIHLLGAYSLNFSAVQLLKHTVYGHFALYKYEQI